MEGRHWRRNGLRENSVARVKGRPIYSYVIARFASFFVICRSYLTRELNVLLPRYLGLLVNFGIWYHTTTAFVHTGSEPHHSASQRQSLGVNRANPPTPSPLSPRLQPTHSSTHNGGGLQFSSSSAHWEEEPVARGCDVTRVYVITRPAGRRREPRKDPVASSAAVCPYGAVARVCVRRLPGASRGLRVLAGAGATGHGAALALELAEAGTRASAPGTSVPRGTAGGRLGRPHRAARPALAPRGCGVSACGACLPAALGLPGTCARSGVLPGLGGVRVALLVKVSDV